MLRHIKKLFTFLILGIGISLFFSDPAQGQGLFIRGDINCDGVVDSVDLPLWNPLGDFPADCPVRYDVNDDGILTTPDTIYLKNFLFFGGPPPPHPFPACGRDTTAVFNDCAVNCCCTLTTQCNDGLDNDGDGLIDFPCDRGCSDACDTSEAPFSTTQCTDGIDNDGDGLVDLADTNCVDSCDFSEFSVCLYKPGDFNGNGLINLSDIIRVVSYIFKGGQSPNPPCTGDANADGKTTITDIVYVVNFVFKNGVDPIPSGVCCNPT